MLSHDPRFGFSLSIPIIAAYVYVTQQLPQISLLCEAEIYQCVNSHISLKAFKFASSRVLISLTGDCGEQFGLRRLKQLILKVMFASKIGKIN